jgi:hypothetical protein
MNEKLKMIFARRSVRKYQDREIPEQMVTDILEAAMAAPSAVAKDPWQFIVVRDKVVLKEIAAGLPNGGMLANAGLGIVVCGDINKAHDKQESYMLQDCSAAIENILLAATALGLGSCWLGVHPRPDRIVHLRKVLGIPAEITPIGGACGEMVTIQLAAAKVRPGPTADRSASAMTDHGLCSCRRLLRPTRWSSSIRSRERTNWSPRCRAIQRRGICRAGRDPCSLTRRCRTRP